jgi:hypothetical protein
LSAEKSIKGGRNRDPLAKAVRCLAAKQQTHEVTCCTDHRDLIDAECSIAHGLISTTLHALPDTSLFLCSVPERRIGNVTFVRTGQCCGAGDEFPRHQYAGKWKIKPEGAGAKKTKGESKTAGR